MAYFYHRVNGAVELSQVIMLPLASALIVIIHESLLRKLVGSLYLFLRRGLTLNVIVICSVGYVGHMYCFR